MTELCLKCVNETKKYRRIKYILPTELDFCDRCGEFKPLVVMKNNLYYSYKFLPVTIIKIVICFLTTLIYSIYDHKKRKSQ